MKKFDYLNKEEVNTLFYSTISEDRTAIKDVCIDGRWWSKYGTEQAITFVGKLYKLKNFETNLNEYVLHIGMSKQHPDDRHINKGIAMEVAVENALIDPFAVIKLDNSNFTNFDFKRLVNVYLSTMNLKFVRTKEESEKIA